MSDRLKKELKNWAVFFGVFIFLHFTGLLRPVVGYIQQLVVATGVLQPDTELAESEQLPADYSMSLKTINGTPLTLDSFKDKVIFMNFWATWCPPCVAEMPDIQKLYDSVDHTKIKFVMISLDEDRSKVQPFMDQRDFTMPVYFPGGPRPEVFQTSAIPSTFVISPEGKIVAKRSGLASYNTEDFRAFLNNMAK